LVIYYSFEGNTRLVADAIAQATGAALAPLRPEREPPTRGFAKFLWFAWQRTVRRRVRLAPLDVDPAQYDLLFVGAPVWAGEPAPPVTAFLRDHPLAGHRAALFCCHEGGAKSTLARMRALVPDATVVGEIDFDHALSGGEATVARAQAWARALTGAAR
jgi:flavodoxin